MTHAFRQVDVFSDGPFTGNPVAVIASAADCWRTR
ncbi:PhzF family phenazine biosynthesis protein [Nesterenkonia massiliensis]|nr:PhzF family phenazine biosynthesis protein [Nesterenkonia massiliensis]